MCCATQFSPCSPRWNEKWRHWRQTFSACTRPTVRPQSNGMHSPACVQSRAHCPATVIRLLHRVYDRRHAQDWIGQQGRHFALYQLFRCLVTHACLMICRGQFLCACGIPGVSVGNRRGRRGRKNGRRSKPAWSTKRGEPDLCLVAHAELFPLCFD